MMMTVNKESEELGEEVDGDDDDNNGDYEEDEEKNNK